MILNYKNFIKESLSGPCLVTIDGEELVLRIDIKSNSINLISDGKIYDNLSVELPETTELRKDEFFINPDIDFEIIKQLTEQNFISKTSTTTSYGEQKTISYILNI